MPRKTTSAGVTQQQGFNLLELLVVLGLIAIIFGVAMPAGQAMMERGQLRAATNEVYSALLFARNEATRLRQDTQLCFVTASSATSCSGSATSLLGVFSDASSSNIPVRVFELNESVVVTLNAQGNEIEFQRLGNLSNSGSVFFDLQVGSQQKQIEACFNGRIIIRKTAGTSEC